MKLTEQGLRQMIDFTLLHNSDTVDDVIAFAQKAKEGHFASAFIMPCYTELLVRQLRDAPDVHAGAPVAFPTGAEPTAIKVAMAQYHVAVGVDEVDFVINVGWLKSGKTDEILDEIRQIVAAAQGRIVKVILEVTCLTDEEIATATRLVCQGGADYVKTGTGFMPNPTTIHHIEVIRSAIDDKTRIKAAGGIRDIDTVLSMLRLGVTRFGIGWTSALSILEQFKGKYPDGIEI